VDFFATIPTVSRRRIRGDMVGALLTAPTYLSGIDDAPAARPPQG